MKPSAITRATASPQTRLLLLFALEGMLLQYVSSTNGFANNLYATNLGATDSQIAMNQLIPNLVAVVLMLPFGMLANRMRSAKTVPIAMLLFMGMMYIGLGTVPMLGQGRMLFYFLFLAMTAGLVATYNAQWQSLFDVAVAPEHQNTTYALRTRVMFLVATLTPLVLGPGVAHAAGVDEKLGVLRIYYYLSAAFLFLQALILSRLEVTPSIHSEKKPSVTDMLAAIPALFRDKKFLFFFIPIFFFHLGWHSDWSMWYIGQTQYLGFSEAHLSYFTALESVFRLLGVTFWAAVNRKKNIHFSMAFGTAGYMLGPVSILIAILIGGKAGLWFFMVAGTVITFPQSAVSLCVLQMLLEALPPKNRAVTISVYTMFITLSSSIMPFLAVKYYELWGSNHRAFCIFAVTVAIWRGIAALVFLWRYRLYKRKHPLLT